ncbi:hypothetical protein BE17_23430 [Sorangium cellulosum]|uniref:Uncharacterized protein n=1 Tax=Sorangium cellulosum TaxID=56 RepID=A0A150RDC1_SORCE|nr:hypothetical protein BE17_23430 [Sorangium cellulosum]
MLSHHEVGRWTGDLRETGWGAAKSIEQGCPSLTDAHLDRSRRHGSAREHMIAQFLRAAHGGST